MGGPKDFYDPVPLQTPFVYDPSGGNLLLDMLWRGVQDTGNASFDFIEDTNQNFTQYIYSYSPDSIRREYTTGGLIWEFTFGPEPGIRGDYNGNGELDAGDLDLQASVGIATQDLTYDLNGDSVVDYAGDRVMWLHELKNVYVGDANLDSEFNSNDFVQVFQAGKYETALSCRLGRRGLGRQWHLRQQRLCCCVPGRRLRAGTTDRCGGGAGAGGVDAIGDRVIALVVRRTNSLCRLTLFSGGTPHEDLNPL